MMFVEGLGDLLCSLECDLMDYISICLLDFLSLFILFVTNYHIVYSFSLRWFRLSCLAWMRLARQLYCTSCTLGKSYLRFLQLVGSSQLNNKSEYRDYSNFLIEFYLISLFYGDITSVLANYFFSESRISRVFL